MLGPMAQASDVQLREIDAKTLHPILKLKVKSGQEHFVAPNSVSISEAHFSDAAWFRGIYAGDEPVGFVMLALDPAKPEFDIWRFMIDARYQGKGYGHRAMELIIEHMKSEGAKEIFLGVVPGEGSAQPFYAKLGFEPTGEIDDGEIIMRLDVSA